MWTGPWDTHVPVGENQAAGLKRGQKETPDFGDKASLPWKGGRISFFTCQCS